MVGVGRAGSRVKGSEWGEMLGEMTKSAFARPEGGDGRDGGGVVCSVLFVMSLSVVGGSVRASPHWLELASEGQPKPPTGSAQLRRMSFWIGL